MWTIFLQKEFNAQKRTYNVTSVFRNASKFFFLRQTGKLNLSLQLLKTTEDKEVIITPKLLNELLEPNHVLHECCQLTFRQPLPDKQVFLMTHLSIRAANYAALEKDNPNQKFTSTLKTYARVV